MGAAANLQHRGEKREVIVMQTVRMEKQVTAPVVATRECGDCRYHMPYATDSRSVCTCSASTLYEEEVFTGQPGCSGFSAWPKGSPAPLFLNVMRH